ncbi:DUF2800 domain-containing protein [Candidatus Williamhamiltonella defendens]|uniref:Uncharacterized protein n=1 Tax=Candidatus Hamiltonella defensa (Bemisia tabaci) TaxID=672795 RepID=A0A249DWU5_9ENTR|nr:DUF2800 domain-containing protein [Candidatus Hamiltonella defensa]ASX25891.1 hypothetical protein BA171_01740 [Candidatus Hamiltonella defensa (Bemisia tabaci)]CED78260.1 APSE P51-like protein [Candidatus Hamiltonella defensa (Bemisia tabaci)]
MTEHAKLSASGAHRWMVCSGSVTLEATCPDVTSDYAEYGTAAHEMAARCLKENVTANFFAGQSFNGYEADTEMVEAIQRYLDYVHQHQGSLLIEQKVDFSPWVPEGFGTCDCLIIEGHTASVIDLKMGKGVRVEAENNPQALLYALGALNEYEFIFDHITTFKLAIVQPRLDHISEHEISRDELLVFGETAKKRAALALAPNADFRPDQKACKFCRAKARCRALAERSLQLAAQEFHNVVTPITLKNITLLNNRDIAALLPQLNMMADWIKSVEATALQELEQGRDIPGYKLVTGRSIRKWRDEAQAEQSLRNTHLKVAEIFTQKLVSPAQAEKLLGKKHQILDELAIHPEGKPIIAPKSDKRPALRSSAEEEFKKVA